jgi:hypothetical protein
MTNAYEIKKKQMKWIGRSQLHYNLVLTNAPSPLLFTCISQRDVTRKHKKLHLPARPRTQHDCHHDTKVKREAAAVVIELLMIGGKTPETC